MSESNKELTSAVSPETALDQAMAYVEAFIADIEKQCQQADELAQVPDDVPRFVTRFVL